MNRGFQRQVNPKTAALVILLVIAGVQAWWWRAFIYRPRTPMPAMRMSGGGVRPGPPTVTGSPDVHVSTVAGDVTPGMVDGLGRDARFDGPCGLALMPDGSLLIADSRNDVVRKLDARGHVSTLPHCAGLRLPSGVAVAPDGTVLVTDTGNHRVCTLTPAGLRVLAGGARGCSVGVGAAAAFDSPTGVVWDSAGKRAIVADTGNRRLCAVTLDGRTVELARLGAPPVAVAVGQGLAAAVPALGAIVVNGRSLGRLPVSQWGTDEAEPSVATLTRPAALCAGADGWFATDSLQAAVMHVSGGAAQVIAGTYCGDAPVPVLISGQRDFAGDKARFGRLGGLAYDGANTLYAADTTGNTIRRLTLPR